MYWTKCWCSHSKNCNWLKLKWKPIYTFCCVFSGHGSLEAIGTWESLAAAQATKKCYTCVTCQRIFPTPWKLKRHCVIHTGEKPYKCGICYKLFNVRDNLKAHMRGLHGDVAPIECPVCLVWMPREKMAQHMVTHQKTKWLWKVWTLDMCQCTVNEEMIPWSVPHAACLRKTIQHAVCSVHVYKKCIFMISESIMTS